MQDLRARQRMHYANLGLRSVAVIVDTLIILLVSSVLLAVLSVSGLVDLGLKNVMTLNDIYDSSRAAPGWLTPLEYGLIFLYFTLFELTGATPGKRLFRLTVARDDGTRLTSTAVVVRNLIRIPEMYLLYVPSAIACLTTRQNKRLGDLAAGTVVVRRGNAPAVDLPAPETPAITPPAPEPPGPPTPPLPGPPDLAAGLAAFKTAALALAGAHRSYLRSSDTELAATDAHGGEPQAYAPEYVAAWYTLTDVVTAAQQAQKAAESAAATSGTTLDAAFLDQPDLARLSDELRPYFSTRSDEEIHEAYMRVARGETTV